jgi:hypothetical protein
MEAKRKITLGWVSERMEKTKGLSFQVKLAFLLLLSHLHNGFGWIKMFHLQLRPEI